MYSKQQIKCFQFLRIPIAKANRITRASEESLRMNDRGNASRDGSILRLWCLRQADLVSFLVASSDMMT